MARLFGTDGVRGVANKDLTADMAYRLGYAGAVVLAGETIHKPTILIGCDTRISCGMLESALAAGICSAGADAVICGVIPTPAVAYLTRKYHYDAGVMISASHNSYEYNGIKFFSGNGFKLPDHVEDEIEHLIVTYDEKTREYPLGDKVGQRIMMSDAVHLYSEHLKRRQSCDLSGLKIALDCANGAASAIAPSLFRDLGATVFTVADQPDGKNINDRCGSTHMEDLMQMVIREGCDLGFAFDGDADRLLVVDSYGKLVDGDVILALLGLDMKERGELKSETIVITVMSNLGLDIMASGHGLTLEKTKVGDRYVLEKMLEQGYNLGGEQSGHVILLDHATTGDGILTALAFLRAFLKKNIPLYEQTKIIDILPQVLVSARISDDKKESAMKDEKLASAISKYEKQLGANGRILVRASGTEPVIRIMLEGKNKEEIQEMAEHLAELIISQYGV